MKFRKVLLIDNFDSFTFNLVDCFEVLGSEVKVYRNNVSLDIIAQQNFDLLVFSPGPSVPKNAGNLMEIIAKYQEKSPMFGVCLGHEAITEAFGGSLKFVEPVHGRRSDIHHDQKTIFTGLPTPYKAGRYHSLVSDYVPDCFEISAETDNLIMAMRHKTLPIESVQFHPESVLTMENENGLKMLKNILDGNFANLK